ncbi:hypothetical protein NP233_g4816 [Leucocoprinus birnbaumii]|uniref:Peptidase C14 caspase domain-containing protein n=1 Tax=Leucocoprinus birnbaumii TaxID=56174 RepID=A0AAD5VU15_9AGAR|nr:hypothetical protein NP233_g4816 [Leucocoprinus birnbaumii]
MASSFAPSPRRAGTLQSILSYIPRFSSDDAGASRQKRKKALLIGINYLTLAKGRGRLYKSHNDVDIIQKLLIGWLRIFFSSRPPADYLPMPDIYDYKLENITVMIDNDKAPYHLQPNRENIEREMTNLVAGPIEEGDEFFIYYAGHATQCKERVPNTERDHQDEYLLPVDAIDKDIENVVLDNALIDNRLREILVQPLIQTDVGCQLIAIMDACTSGTILDLDHDECNKVIGWKSRFLEVPPGVKSRVRAGISDWLRDPVFACNRVCNRKWSQVKANVICISACEDSQTIVELPDGKTLAGNLDVYLRKCKRPVLKKLNRHIYKQFKETHRKLWKSYNEEMTHHKKKLRGKPPQRPPELDKPQITSLKPLRMNTTLKL